MNLRNALRSLRDRLRPSPPPREPEAPPNAAAAAPEGAGSGVDPVVARILAGEADQVLDLIRKGDLSWDAVFGMEDYILMQVYLPWFDPDSPYQFSGEPKVVPALEFFDQVNERVRNGHHVLQHDDPRERRLGFADVTAREIVYTRLARLKGSEYGDLRGYEVYRTLPSSRMTVRLPRNLAGES